MGSIVETEFPTASLLPKKETGVLNFLTKFPEYDGRGTVIAIFDSGIDPNAGGLQMTTDGKSKIIERFDCSGAGDISMTTIVKPVTGEIKGLSDRILRIPSNWKNPSGEYRIGLRNCYDLLNKCMKERVKKKRKEKLWDNHHKVIYAKCSKKAQDFNKDYESKKTFTREEKLKKEELDSQVDALNTLDRKYNDVGPIYDFVMFHDGNQWWVTMDTSEKGDLDSCTLLTEFSVDPKSYSAFPTNQLFTYSFNVHDDGNILEIVTCASSHGTHVASIAAAHFPGDPSRNGIAPGAQIVSLTIADNRLGTMETGTAIIRAMIRVMKRCKNNNQVHVINMSYGEVSHFSTSGRLGDLMNEVVDKYGVVWVASGGNFGPALFTVSTPPDISTNNIIGVGAFVSPDMMTAEYSLREKLPASCYSWSSRGPTLDGDSGISVCAPGGAITSVPNYTLKSSELLNGTSMAAPHVSGCIAVLISGLIQRNVPYTPYLIKRMLENTAQFHESYDHFAQGCGLVQIERAFEYLTNYYNEKESKVRFKLSCSNTGAKGIIVRSNNVTNINVSVEPVFQNSEEIDSQVKIDFNLNLVLTCEATWVKIPQYLALMNTTRNFVVLVDPTSLSVGVHATCITAYDTQKPEKGPVFRVKVSVFKPEVLDRSLLKPEIKFKEVIFAPNTIKRHFIKVPEDVTWAMINVETSSTSIEKAGRFILHCLQTKPKRSCNTYNYHKIFQLFDRNETPLMFPVKSGLILEVALAKFWSSLGEMKLNYSVRFAGCQPSVNEFVMHHAEGLYSLDLRPSWQTEEIQVDIQLKNSVSVLKPSEASVTPLSSERDVIPPNTIIYQLLLTYNFHISKSTEVMLISPILSKYLYENDYESQMWMLYDSNKKLVATGDAYPDWYMVKLEKGDYTAFQQVRHDSKDLLEKINEMPMLMSQKLPSNITVDTFTTPNNATYSKKLKPITVVGNVTEEHPLYFSPVANDKLPKSTSIGQYLTGSVAFTKDKLGKKVDTYPIKYILSEGTKKNTKSNETVPKSKDEEFDDAYKEFMSSWITKYDPDNESANKLYEKLKIEIENHLPVHTAMLQNLEPENRRYLPGLLHDIPSHQYLIRVMRIADEIITNVDQTALLAYLGTKFDCSKETTSKIKSNFDLQKTTLIEAMGRKGCAMSQCYLIYNKNETESENEGESELLGIKVDIDSLWLNLLKYVDANDVKATHYFALWHAAAFSHYGRLAKLLLKLSEDKCTQEIDSSLRWAFSKLNWEHCHQLYSNRLLVNYPAQYQLF